tara:strand:+ start:4080 stop:5819 length:1740 start_codon:yes stop_codon:yes gene_type:complete
MAQRDNRGIGGFQGPANIGGEGGLIPTIKMPQTRMSFPTPRSGGGGSRKVKPLERLAGIVPYGIEAAFNAFEEPPKILSEKEYYETIRPEGAPVPEEPTELEKARYKAYQVVGPKDTQDRFDAETIAMLAGSLATGRGSDQYNQTLRNIRSSKQAASNTKENRRGAIIQDNLQKITPKNMTFVDINSYKENGLTTDNVRKGFMAGSKAAPEYLIEQKNRKGFIDANSDEALNYLLDNKGQGTVANWVPFTTIDEFKEIPTTAAANTAADLQKWEIGFAQKETSLLDVHNTAGAIVELMNKQIAGEEIGGIGFQGKLTQAINNGFVNVVKTFETIAKVSPEKSMFSKKASGGNVGRQGTGYHAETLYELLQQDMMDPGSVDDQLAAAMSEFEGATKYKFIDRLSSGSLATIEYNSRLLKLAYAAAAAAGQTGRTLSDKDLQFFLEMVGGGSNDSPEVQRAVIRNFVQDITREVDNDPRVMLNKRKINNQYDMNNPTQRGIIKTYYDEVIDDETGKITGYNFVPFYGRYDRSNPSIKRYINSLGSYKGGEALDPSENTKAEVDDLRPDSTQSIYDYFNTGI